MSTCFFYNVNDHEERKNENGKVDLEIWRI